MLYDRLKLLLTIRLRWLNLLPCERQNSPPKKNSIPIVKYFTFSNSWTLSMCSYFSGQFQFWTLPNITAPEIGHWIGIKRFLHDWHFLTLVSTKEKSIKIVVITLKLEMLCTNLAKLIRCGCISLSLPLFLSHSLLKLAASDELLHRWPVWKMVSIDELCGRLNSLYMTNREKKKLCCRKWDEPI